MKARGVPASLARFTVHADAGTERFPTPLATQRLSVSGSAVSPPLASMQQHSRALSSAAAPASPAPSAASIARWKATIATHVAKIQREGWRRGLFGKARLSTRSGPAGQGGAQVALFRALHVLGALFIAHEEAPAQGKEHLHADGDLATPGTPGGRRARQNRIPPLSRFGQLVVLALFLLGMREMLGPSRTAPARRRGPARVRGRDPYDVLRDFEAPTTRYATTLPGLEQLWKTSATSTDAYIDATEAGDTAAVVLHWKRTENVGVILAHLCQYTFFDTILVWNNNPEITLTPQTFAKSRCPASELRIYNSPRNLFFLARYLACAQSSSPYCFFQDDDWVVQPVRSLYAQFKRDPEGPVVVHTNEEVAVLYGLEWCFFQDPLHTCFSWVGTGAFTSRQHVERFLAQTGELAYSRAELAHADNSFTTFMNEPPYVLQSALSQLPSPHGHSDGEGIARNKAFIYQGLTRLSNYLNVSYPPAPATGELTQLSLPRSLPHRAPVSPPLAPHPHAHHARALCTPPSDACLFLTNLAHLPPPDAVPFPGPERVAGGLQAWEEHLGHTARGWKEGGERWSEEEDWARRWAYRNAVDGEVATAFRSMDVVKEGDYVALGLLEPLDAAWTPLVALRVVLADAFELLRLVRVEVSSDGYHWVRFRALSLSPIAARFGTDECGKNDKAPPASPSPIRPTCAVPSSPLPVPPDLPFPSSVLLSPTGSRVLASAKAASSSLGGGEGVLGLLARWWARTTRRRRGLGGTRECKWSVPVAGEGEGWRFVRLVVPVSGRGEGEEEAGGGREVLEVGWGVYEMWIEAERGSASASGLAVVPRRSFTVHPPVGPPPGLWPPAGAALQGALGQQAPPQPGQQQSGASTSLLTIVRAQIVFLLSTLSEDNFVKNRDEIRSLLEHHQPAHAHLVRRLIQGAASLLTASPASPPSASASQPPSPDLHLRLLASEVQRCSRDPALAERFRDAVLEGAEGAAGSDPVLRAFALPTLLAHPTLNELSPLERLVFCAPFLTLLFPSSSAPPTGAKRALGLDAAKVVRQVLHPALDQLGNPAQSVHDLAELSPLPISRLLSILLSDLYLGDAPPAPTESANLEQALTDDDRRSVVLAAVRGRLGPEVGAQALAHAFSEVVFDEQRPPTPIAALARLAPVPALCSLELARAVLAKFGSLGGDGDGVEMRVAQQLFDVIDLAQREGDAGRPGGGVDVGSWIRAVHELHPALRWGDVVRGFDSPLRAPAEGPLALRALAAALQLSPAPQPTPDDPRAN
ncbi:uncharacterized protein JCM10292_000647, partial [Rhodotorula paludigena]|uniref:uncharacterized protein n=1 Tax=Rhodotorula paludigena TaxID=86838 RepID=UPI003174EB52